MVRIPLSYAPTTWKWQGILINTFLFLLFYICAQMWYIGIVNGDDNMFNQQEYIKK